MSVLLTTEDVLRHVKTMLELFPVVVKVDTLVQAMDMHAMVWTDLNTIVICKITLYSHIILVL